MALMLVSTLCSLTLLSTLALGLPMQTATAEKVPVKITVQDEFGTTLNSYHTSVVEGGVLYGALKTLEDSNVGFKFSCTQDPNYGLFLESVNGVKGSQAEHTYWQILSEHDGTVTPLEVGIGCYQPKTDDHIILKYSRWSDK